MIPYTKLKEYFDNIQVRERQTELGIFKPSLLDEINFPLEQLLANGIVNSSELFFDAGFGDGRILQLTARVHGIPSAGAEDDDELVDIAEYHIREIDKLDVPTGNQPSIILTRGDFGKDETYSQAGIRFKDIATFFNYANNPNHITPKIVQQSPKGTKFLYYGGFTPAKFDGLTYEQTLGFEYPNGYKMDVFHVYRK